MHRPYNPQRGYTPEYDARTWHDLVELLRDSNPTGLVWPLLGTRRSGKTWALHALRHALPDAGIVDLTQVNRLPAVTTPIVLVDEPGPFLLARDPVDGSLRPNSAAIDKFVAWCRKLREARQRILVAMTPAEWAALTDPARPACVSPKDLQRHLAPLTPAQARRIARDDAARRFLDAVAVAAPDWLRNSFLTTHLLDLADQRGLLATPDPDLPGLLAAARDDLRGADHNYIDKALYEGLGPALVASLRYVVRREPADPHAVEMLRRIGLIAVDADARFDRLRDPVLADHLPPPLRIHHVSDVHAGPKSARRVNVGDASPTVARLAQAVGEGPIRNSYLEHVQQRIGEGTGPHLLIVSGDLTETGQPQEYADAGRFLTDVRALLRPHPDLGERDERVLLVGGNHDVDWTRTRGDDPRARHLAFARAFADYPRPRLEEPPETRALQVVRYPDAGVEVVLLGSAEHGGEVDDETEIVIEQARAADATTVPPAVLDALKRLAKSDPGLVHAAQLQRLRGYHWHEPVRIVVLHHPVSPLPTTTDIAPYAALLNAGAVKNACIDMQIQLILHGHAHSQWFFEERWPSHSRAGHTLRIASAPSLGSREVYEQHGYNEILVYREGNRHEVSVRGYVREGDTWRTSEGFRPFQAKCV